MYDHGCCECWKTTHSNKMKGKNTELIIQDIIQIKLLLMIKKLTQQEIADIFGVSRRSISDIKNNKTWSYVKIGETL